MKLAPIVALIAGLWTSSGLLADGFSLERSLRNEPNLILNLSDAQMDAVGRWRRLDLTPEQILILRKKGAKPPKTLGVMSKAEPDCSCHLAPAFWLDKNHAVIWLDRLKERKANQWYSTVRLADGRYVVDSAGNLFHKGSPVSLAQFESTLSQPRRKGEWIQVSLSPNIPKKLYSKLLTLQKRYQNFGFRL